MSLPPFRVVPARRRVTLEVPVDASFQRRPLRVRRAVERLEMAREDGATRLDGLQFEPVGAPLGAFLLVVQLVERLFQLPPDGELLLADSDHGLRAIPKRL